MDRPVAKFWSLCCAILKGRPTASLIPNSYIETPIFRSLASGPLNFDRLRFDYLWLWLSERPNQWCRVTFGYPIHWLVLVFICHQKQHTHTHTGAKMRTDKYKQVWIQYGNPPESSLSHFRSYHLAPPRAWSSFPSKFSRRSAFC